MNIDLSRATRTILSQAIDEYRVERGAVPPCVRQLQHDMGEGRETFTLTELALALASVTSRDAGGDVSTLAALLASEIRGAARIEEVA